MTPNSQTSSHSTTGNSLIHVLNKKRSLNDKERLIPFLCGRGRAALINITLTRSFYF